MHDFNYRHIQSNPDIYELDGDHWPLDKFIPTDQGFNLAQILVSRGSAKESLKLGFLEVVYSLRNSSISYQKGPTPQEDRFDLDFDVSCMDSRSPYSALTWHAVFKIWATSPLDLRAAITRVTFMRPFHLDHTTINHAIDMIERTAPVCLQLMMHTTTIPGGICTLTPPKKEEVLVLPLSEWDIL